MSFSPRFSPCEQCPSRGGTIENIKCEKLQTLCTAIYASTFKRLLEPLVNEFSTHLVKFITVVSKNVSESQCIGAGTGQKVGRLEVRRAKKRDRRPKTWVGFWGGGSDTHQLRGLRKRPPASGVFRRGLVAVRTDENFSKFNLAYMMYLFYFMLQTAEAQCAVYWDAIAGQIQRTCTVTNSSRHTIHSGGRARWTMRRSLVVSKFAYRL